MPELFVECIISKGFWALGFDLESDLGVRTLGGDVPLQRTDVDLPQTWFTDHMRTVSLQAMSFPDVCYLVSICRVVCVHNICCKSFTPGLRMCVRESPGGSEGGCGGLNNALFGSRLCKCASLEVEMMSPFFCVSHDPVWDMLNTLDHQWFNWYERVEESYCASKRIDWEKFGIVTAPGLNMTAFNVI